MIRLMNELMVMTPVAGAQSRDEPKKPTPGKEIGTYVLRVAAEHPALDGIWGWRCWMGHPGTQILLG